MSLENFELIRESDTKPKSFIRGPTCILPGLI